MAWHARRGGRGKQFLVLRRAGGEAKAIVIHNWRRELREKLRGAKP